MLRFVKIFLFASLSVNLATASAADAITLVINELMASNSACKPDPQGQYDDWIEIYNYGTNTVNIGRMYLTDNLSDPKKWRIPASTNIPPGGHLLIWADNDTGDSGLHTNFKLDAKGEEIGLFDTDGETLIDSVSFPVQTTDVSYGRYPDAADDWRLFDNPSPGGQNQGGYLGQVEPPQFSYNRGFYDQPFYLTIATETESATIYYTLDGSDPLELNLREDPIGIIYSDPILIDKTTCLRAVAVKPDWKPSYVNTRTYVFLNDVIRQDFQSTLDAGFPTMWGSWPSPDYGLDRDIIGTFDFHGNSLGGDSYDGIYAATIYDDLKSIPTLSIVMDIDDLFGDRGIYSNPIASGSSWERPASVELIYPDQTEGFQVNCGIRIQGGYFRRNDLTRKHSFRLLFKGIYGPTELKFPLFGKDDVDSFETIVLRAGANDGYTWNEARYTEQYTRDEFGRRLQLATGHAGGHGIFVHLYINGIYWGLYNPCERPDNSFSASYYGGDRDNWDAIHEGGYPGGIEAVNGDFKAWNQMIDKCREAANSSAAYQELQGNNPDGTPNPAYKNLLDITNYVDYMIINIWAGNWDWPWKNYWLGRDRSENSTGFKFYNWDFENTLGNNLGRSPLEKNALNNDFSDAGLPHQYLKNNTEYRLFFADRIHRLFFDDGILTPESLIARYTDLAAGVERAIVAESARWGDMQHDPPLTLEDWYDRDSNYNDGRAGRDWILNYYLPQRTDIVLKQFRNAGLYPNIDAPEFQINGSYQHGGQITKNSVFSMTTNRETAWFTLDGSDPRLPETSGDNMTTILVAEDAVKHVIVPEDNINQNWKGGGAFDDSDWLYGTGGVGYDTGADYRHFINIDLYNQMYQGRTGCYIRIPFTFNNINGDLMTLRMRYDDGFVAYINGIEVARSNAPESPQWDSTATAQNSDSAAVNFQDFDLSPYFNILNPGENILAIHGLNISLTSSDFLISPELVLDHRNPVGDIGISPSAIQYTDPIALTESTHIKARVLDSGTWSALNEATYAIGPVAENLRITELMYHPDNDPNEEYVELTNIGNETINLNLVKFTNGIDFTFPDIDLSPGEYVVVVQDMDAFESRYGIGINIAGQYTGRLNNAGEKIRLEDAIGQTILEFSYKDNWRSITDGDDFSLTIINPANPDPNSWGQKDSWRASAYTGGSPGWDDSGIVPDPGSVVINEILAHSHENAPDWIELYNTTSAPINIGGWYISDSNINLTKYKIAAGTTIAPYGYKVFYEDTNFNNPADPGSLTGFALSENGESLYLSSAQNNVLTGYREMEDFGASQTGISFGRYYKDSTGNYNFVAMSQTTEGAANAYPKVGPIVISEIMYNPDWPFGGSYTDQQYEYIKLTNISSGPVSLYDFTTSLSWKFTSGIDFTFPQDLPVTIAAGGSLYVVKHPAAFSWRYPEVPSDKILGPYEGNLSNSGESLELSMPGEVDGMGGGFYIRIDRVNYSDGSHPGDNPGGVDLWPAQADGEGYSLVRKELSDYGNDPDNWLAASPSPVE